MSLGVPVQVSEPIALLAIEKMDVRPPGLRGIMHRNMGTQVLESVEGGFS